jgi:hypothetical protein
MFRLGRLKAPRKVQAASCLHLQLSEENLGDPARGAVLSDRLGDPTRVAKKVPVRVARREANTHPALAPSQHICNSLKTIRVGTAHPSVKMTPFAPASRRPCRQKSHDSSLQVRTGHAKTVASG